MLHSKLTKVSNKNSNKKSENLQVAPKSLTHKEILFVLSGLMVGMLLAALDQTIVSTALTAHCLRVYQQR